MNYTVGLSIGTESIGWALLSNDSTGNPEKIENLGVRIFPSSEHPKTGVSLTSHRRECRIKRRYLRRKRYRKERVKALFVAMGLTTEKHLENLFTVHSTVEKDVYTLRGDGLDRLLTPDEWVRVLLHLSQRCGYFSLDSTQASGTEKSGIVQQTIAENQALMREKGYRTVGEMLCLDSKFQTITSDGRIWRNTRNHNENYKINVSCEMVEKEVEALFRAQRSMGNPYATEAFQQQYTDILFTRRSYDEGPGGDSPYQVQDQRGFCPFEKTERRAFKSCYTAEYFKMFQDLNKIRIISPGKPDRFFTFEERKIIANLAIKQESPTFWELREALALPDTSLFNVVSYRQSSIEDAESNQRFFAMQVYHTIREALGEREIDTITPGTLDCISEVLSLYRGKERRADALQKLGLSSNAIQALQPLSFHQVGPLSIKAMRKLMPYLERGLSYPAACKAVYGENTPACTPQKFITLNSYVEKCGALAPFTHPTMLRALSQTTKVLNAIVREYGSPQRVLFQLDPKLKSGKNEWFRTQRKKQEQQHENDALMKEIALIKGERPTGYDLVKYKLYREQEGICPYTGKQLELSRIFCEPDYVQVSHIVPYSISFDDSYYNKVLACTEACRQKQELLPMECFASIDRDAFISRVKSSHLSYPKRRRLLKQSITPADRSRYYEQNIVDTHYLARAVCNLLENHLIFAPGAGKGEAVYAVNEIITEQVRRRLGLECPQFGELQSVVKAAVVGSTTPDMLCRIANHARREAFCGSLELDACTDLETGEIISRAEFDQKYPVQFPEPWPGFCQELQNHLSVETKGSDTVSDRIPPLSISRMPQRRARGPAHQETIRSGKIPGYVISKTPLTALKLDRSGEIRDYYRPNDDRLLYEALKERLIAFQGSGAKAFAQPFYKPKRDGTPGPIVKKVKTWHKVTSVVEVCGGVANHSQMIRVDIFYIPNEGYFFIPIYIADTVKKVLPQKAFVRRQGLVREMDDADFQFSLYPGDVIRVVSERPITLEPVDKSSGDNVAIAGQEWMLCFVSAGVATGTFEVTSQDGRYKKRSLGIKTLLTIEKYDVDILGRCHKVHLPEKRRGFFPSGQ